MEQNKYLNAHMFAIFFCYFCDFYGKFPFFSTILVTLGFVTRLTLSHNKISGKKNCENSWKTVIHAYF